MLPVIFTWLGLTTASHAMKRVLDAGANGLAPEKLSSDLSAVIQEWASGLAQSGVGDTLISVLFVPTYDEPGPARLELRKSIEEQELPSADTWFRALYERWSEVRRSGDDLQPFFMIEPAQVQPLLRDLAGRLERVCRSDRSLFQVSVVGMLRSISSSNASVERMLLEREPPTPPPSADDVIRQLRASSIALLRYPSTVTQHGHFIPRPELLSLIEKVNSSKWSATVLLGERGAGKSALLSRMANEVIEKGWALLAIKADMLPGSMSAESLTKSISFEMSVEDAIRLVARDRKVLVLLDQVDAIAEISDRKTDRLNILLDLVHRVSTIENVHIVLSSREFEFRTDSRLTSLQFDSLRLDLPPFEDTIAILEEAGNTPAAFGEVLRELLRSPLALKIFLDIARPNDHFTSLGSLLERYWSMHVTGGANAADRVQLLERIAHRMTDEENLSVPLAIADDVPDALNSLLAVDMLIQDERSIAFRHQAFYEFTVARRFSSGRADLLSHVIERQDGLFVRPTILTSLVLLRETSPRVYERVVTALMSDAAIRPHVKALVTDFLGSQQRPTPVEANLLLPLLEDEVLGTRMLNAVAGSSGWFSMLQADPRFVGWLTNPDRAYRCLAMLTAAVDHLPQQVVALVAQHWIVTPSFDGLTAQIIRSFDSIDEITAQIAEMIVGRTKSVDWLVEHIGACDPFIGARLIGVDLDRRLRETCEALDNVYDRDYIRRSFEQFFDRDDRHELLADIADKAPRELLIATWRRFVSIAGILAHDVRHPDRAYRRIWKFEFDLGPLPEPSFVHAFRIAMRRFAEIAVDDYLAFAGDSATSDVLTVHALLAEGFEIAAAARPNEVAQYLLSDQRRLAIGPEGKRYSTSARLIAAIHCQLDDEYRSRLISAIVSCTPYTSNASDDAEKRIAMARWNRQHRLGLLKALDTRFIDDSLRRHIMAEERLIGGETPQPRRVRAVWVGSRMKKDEIEKAHDAELVRLIDELADVVPRDKVSNIDPERSGGAEQLADEIGKAVERTPERALRLIQILDPERHQSYAPSLLESLIKAGVDLDVVYGVVRELDQKGFCEGSFRQRVGWALKKRGEGKGLPADIVAMLERWLEEMPTDGEGESHFVQYRERQPILAGQHLGGGWPFRGSVFAAFSVGVLERTDPAVDRWIERVRRDIGQEKSLPYWELVIGQMGTCLNANPGAANAVLGEIMANHPGLFERVIALTCIGNYASALEIGRLRGWLAEMRRIFSPVTQQAWGEFFMLQRDLGEDDSETITTVLESGDSNAALGLSYGACYVWHMPTRKTICAETLIAAIRRFGVESAAPLSHFLRHLETTERIDVDAERVIRTMLASPPLAEKLITELLAVVEAFATAHPDLTYDVTKTLLDLGHAKLGNPREVIFTHAGDLTTLALTLHRQSSHRAAGLELFERLIALNVSEAEAALELLDRRAARRYAPRPRRRVRRSHRQSQPSYNLSGNLLGGGGF